MNILEYIEDNSEFDDEIEFPSIGKPNPNYDPGWDFYPATSVDHKVIANYEEALEQASKLSNMLNLGPIVIYFSDDLEVDNHVARYVNGTYSHPVVIATTKDIGRFETEITLYHELGHAFFDSVDEENIPEQVLQNEEETVEEFAHRAATHLQDAVKWLRSKIWSTVDENIKPLDRLLEYLLL